MVALMHLRGRLSDRLFVPSLRMRKHYLICFGRKRWHKPAEKNCGSKSSKDLGHDKTRRVDRTNPGKGIRKRPCERDRRIGERG